MELSLKFVILLNTYPIQLSPHNLQVSLRFLICINVLTESVHRIELFRYYFDIVIIGSISSTSCNFYIANYIIQ